MADTALHQPTPGPDARRDRDGVRAHDLVVAARPLRTTLRANAVFSVGSGLVAILAAGAITDWLGVDLAWLVRLIGLGLVGYGGLLVAAARTRPATLCTLGLLATLADVGWVVGTIVIVASGAVDPSGAWLLGAVALVVLAFAVEQLVARRRLVRVLHDTRPGAR